MPGWKGQDVAGFGQVGEGAPEALRSLVPWLAAMSRRRASRSWATESSARAWLVRKVQVAINNMLRNSRNGLLVFGYERSVQGRHRNSAANGGQLPGLPRERPPAGLVIAIAVVMALAVPRIRLRLPVPVAADVEPVTR